MTVSSADIAIIGAGPIGIELAVALKKAGASFFHFDARQIGHTISWFAPQTRFFSSNDRISIAGVPLTSPDQTKSTREQYLAYLRGVVEQFDLQINTYEPITEIRRVGQGFELTSSKANGKFQYNVRRLVLATGGTVRPRRLEIPGEDLPHVSHYFRDPHDYFRKRLLIIGGRNSAIEAALRSHHCGADVSISYRRAQLDSASIKYWLWPELNGLIASGKIHAHLQTRPTGIFSDHVQLKDESGATRNIAADFVLLLVGYEADMSLCRMAGIELRGSGQIPTFNPATMETNVPNLYIAGTAVAGTQEKYALFLENCHVHVDRITASLNGTPLQRSAPIFDRPET